eukprot:CAMPEP_0194602972 /NCGR_PEP_ID=MMETSP0292-20121207/29969_1 /TAXON_ID=39354 /ORGANISM="Heterosigma akashiwo, Strain CCMP2393" /LENGTH=357 /DNA_ID=CAMNT_0039465319 /DNA_START=113 /DNA_END=1185 /DNA_ORIENTATION=+
MALQQRKLLLHFDINKTLIVSDVAGGVGTEQMINSLLSEVAWGKINADTQAWELLSEEPSVCAPDESTGWMTFNEYLENILKPEKAQKRAVKTSFTEEGKIGESFRPAYERILNALALPEDVRAAAAAAVPALAGGQCFILPCFFELLLALQARGRAFSLVFRTFGHDLPQIAEEFNAFCEGRHPCWPHARMDGTGGTADRRLKLPQASGKFYRDGEGGDGMHLAMIDSTTQLVEISHGVEEVWKTIIEKSAGGTTLGLSDCYPWWRDNNESDTSGKLLLVAGDEEHGEEEVGVAAETTWSETGRTSWTCAAAAPGAPPVPFARSKDRFIFKAEPFAAILDRQYYINALELLESNNV